MVKIVACALRMITRAGTHLPDAEIEAKLVEVLIERRSWEAAEVGLITREELANLVLAHLDTLVERRTGVRPYDPMFEKEDCVAMQRALFGRWA